MKVWVASEIIKFQSVFGYFHILNLDEEMPSLVIPLWAEGEVIEKQGLCSRGLYRCPADGLAALIFGRS